MIKYQDDIHEYRTSNGEKYVPVTSFMSMYKNTFDADLMSGRCAGKISSTGNDYRGMDKYQVLAEWDRVSELALRKGNKYHDMKEQQDLEDSGLVSGYQETIDLTKLESKVYPELRVYLPEYKIAGHIDRPKITRYPEPIDGWLGEVEIEDYKTNQKAIEKVGYNNNKMKAPIDYLNDCSYVHYGIQLITYGYILEYWGYKVKGLKIIHKRFLDDEAIPEKYHEERDRVGEFELRATLHIPIIYRPEIVKSMLEHFKMNHKV